MDLPTLAKKVSGLALEDKDFYPLENKELSDLVEELKAINTNQMLLKHYLDRLAEFLFLAQKIGISRSEATIFEFGAHQQDTNYSSLPYNSSIAHFFAMDGDKLGVDYHCFDPSFSIARFDQNLKDTMRREWRCKLELTYTPELKRKLRERILALSFMKYEQIENEIFEELKKQRIPVIISNAVFFDPDLSCPFWTLPGLHIHSGDIDEINMIPYWFHNENLKTQRVGGYTDIFYWVNTERISDFLFKTKAKTELMRTLQKPAYSDEVGW